MPQTGDGGVARHTKRRGVASTLTPTAIVGRADGRKRRGEQLLAHLVGRGEATVEIEDDRFGHWPVALDYENLVAWWQVKWKEETDRNQTL